MTEHKPSEPEAQAFTVYKIEDIVEVYATTPEQAFIIFIRHRYGLTSIADFTRMMIAEGRTVRYRCADTKTDKNAFCVTCEPI